MSEERKDNYRATVEVRRIEPKSLLIEVEFGMPPEISDQEAIDRAGELAIKKAEKANDADFIEAGVKGVVYESTCVTLEKEEGRDGE